MWEIVTPSLIKIPLVTCVCVYIYNIIEMLPSHSPMQKQKSMWLNKVVGVWTLAVGQLSSVDLRVF